MKRYITLLLLISTVSILDLQARLKNILIIHSYNCGLSWTDRINEGIFESFSNQYHRTIDLRCEFMDAKYIESSDYFVTFKNYLAYKYSKTPIDLVICSDNTAFDFLTMYHRELYGDTPVVFCGVNYCDSVPKGFTGIMEDIALSDNLKLMMSIHPQYHKLYIINDRSITGRSITKELNRIITNDFPRLRYEYVTDYTLAELETKLTQLKPNDIVLLLLFNFDRLGTPYSYDVILDEILPYCKVPMYGTWSFYLNKGIVGGKITDGYYQGVMVSSIAKKILGGKIPSEIPVVDGPTQYVFDYNVLNKFNISSSSLPRQREITNLPYDFILKNRQFFTFLFVIILLLVIIIMLLYWQIQKARKNLEMEQDLVSTIEEKSAELEKALEIAEQSSRLKSAFLANISHEIRTPMNGILGFTSLLNEDDEENVRREYIKVIRSCGEQLLNIISDILDMSLIESRQIKINEDIVSINQTISELICILEKHRNIENKVLKKFFFFKDGDDYIVTDKTKLKQILSNLMTNAIKFTNDGAIVISYYIKDGDMEFSVKDKGIGIAPEHLSMIFERFTQVNFDTSRLYGGNGLGLSITKAYVEMLGGKIWVESTQGQGSTFFFTIPYQKAEKRAVD